MEFIKNIEKALADIKQGKMIIITDAENRENEADLMIAAEFATTETIHFMAKYGQGIICTPMIRKDLERLHLPQMVAHNTDNHQTAFTVTIDHVHTTTGVSPEERAYTIQSLLKKETKPQDLRRPGHVFPLLAREGGVLVRQGHTEAAVDLARLAGCYPAGVICEIVAEDGRMLKGEGITTFAKEHGLTLITIEDLILYRKATEPLVHRAASSHLPTKYGDFTIHVYENEVDNYNHLAIVKGDVSGKEQVLTRVHSECLTGDVFGSLRCDCGEQLEAALRQIERNGEGVLIYMRQEGRGIGLVNKIKAYVLQEQGFDTVEANEKLGFPDDMREYFLSAQILEDLGVKSVNLLTNNPRKTEQLRRYGMAIEKRIPLVMPPNRFNKKYLYTKKVKLGHIFKDQQIGEE